MRMRFRRSCRVAARKNQITSGATEMGRPVALVLYAVAMVAAIVGVDLALFRNLFWGRLMVNIGIVLVFVAFYLSFFRRS